MDDIFVELQSELATFPGREENLRAVYRWLGWEPMFYRPHLFSHSKKVARLVMHVMPVVTNALENFDTKRAIALALVHDDPEILTGDYPASEKAKMTPEQLAAIDAEERAAIAQLSERFPETLGGFIYRDLQEDIQDLRTPEARVAKYLDVLDAYGEGLHELYAGNTQFAAEMTNEFKTSALFDALNISRRAKMMDRYPELTALKDAHVFFEASPILDWGEAIEARSLHTRESLEVPVGYPQYDEWKKVIVGSGDAEEIENLHTQREF